MNILTKNDVNIQLPSAFSREVLDVIKWILPFKTRYILFNEMEYYPRVVMNKNANITLLLLWEISKDTRFKKLGIHISEIDRDPSITESLNYLSKSDELKFLMNPVRSDLSINGKKDTSCDLVVLPSFRQCEQPINCNSLVVKDLIDYIYLITSVFSRYIHEKFIGKSRSNLGKRHKAKTIEIFEVFEFGGAYLGEVNSFIKELISLIPYSSKIKINKAKISLSHLFSEQMSKGGMIDTDDVIKKIDSMYKKTLSFQIPEEEMSPMRRLILKNTGETT